MKETVKNGRLCGIVAEKLAPVFQGPIRCQHSAFPAGITIQDNIEQIIGRLIRNFLSQEKIVNNQKIGFGKELGSFLPLLELGGFKEVFEKLMGFAVHDLIAGLDGGLRSGFRDMAFPCTGRSDQQGIFAVSNELAADEFIDFLFRQFRIETPVELCKGGPYYVFRRQRRGSGKVVQDVSGDVSNRNLPVR